MFRFVFIVSSALSLLALKPRDLEACKCRDYGVFGNDVELQYYFDNTRFVFIGVTREVAPDQNVTLEVLRSYKGLKARRVTVQRPSTTCDYWFEPNQVYVVYSRGPSDGPEHVVSKCSRTGPMEGRMKDIAFLSGKEPLLLVEDTVIPRRYVGARTAADTTAPPFSAGVLVGNTFYLSGKIGLTKDRRVPDSAAEEARLVLDDVKATLEAAGMSMDDLVSVQIFSSDLSQYDVFNRVYRTYFKNEFPARAFLGSGPLLFGARFEVQGIAVKR